MRRLLALGCAGALLAACASTGQIDARVTAGKAIADAWAGLDGASLAADAAAKSGLLKGPTAKTVADDLLLAKASLDAATSAYQANQSANVGAQIAAATAAVAAVLTIVGQAQGQHQ